MMKAMRALLIAAFLTTSSGATPPPPEPPQPSASPTATANVATSGTIKAAPRDIDVSDHGAVGDGKNDDSPALQRAIDAAAVAGGGFVYVKRMALSGNTLALSSTITLKANVIVKPDPGIIMKWRGEGGGTMFTTGAGELPSPVSHTGFEGYGVTIDPNASSNPAGTIFDINGAQDSLFAGVEILDASATAIGFHLRANVREKAFQSRNCTRNDFRDITIRKIGTAFLLRGVFNGPKNIGQPTLNSFFNIHMLNVFVCGVNFSYFCDNNDFSGVTRITLNSASPANGVGVIFNDCYGNYKGGAGGPSIEGAVYANSFERLAVDTFGTPEVDNRKGIVMNKTKQNVVRNFHNAPPARGGAIDVAHADSYLIEQIAKGGGVEMHVWSKHYFVEKAPGVESTPASQP
jgi:hypothetical protein